MNDRQKSAIETLVPEIKDHCFKAVEELKLAAIKNELLGDLDDHFGFSSTLYHHMRQIIEWAGPAI